MKNQKFPSDSMRIFLIILTLSIGVYMTMGTIETLPRNYSLPLFDPHVKNFSCNFETLAVPRVDAEADEWVQEALALEDPMIFSEDRDYPKIVDLLKRAAARKHWKAILNLASIYVEHRVPGVGARDALLLVEEGIRLGIPGAYDRMGTYYSNGTGVQADITRAYAFWQKAASLGSPHALTHLGDKLHAGIEGVVPGYWSNVPVATGMLECALRQGHGEAAYILHFLYLRRSGEAASDTIAANRRINRALNVLQLGTKLGCEECAGALAVEFSAGDPDDDLKLPRDKARSERYLVLSSEIGFNRLVRFPNLDKVLPLPPASLPRWNGDRDTLIAAAMGVSLPLAPGQQKRESLRSGREFLDSKFRLALSGENTDLENAPYEGYWTPFSIDTSFDFEEKLSAVHARLYLKDEKFLPPYSGKSHDIARIENLRWAHWLTVPHDLGNIRPTKGPATRLGDGLSPRISCASIETCPATGIWQPWVDAPRYTQLDSKPISRRVLIV